ncbi:MAG: 2-enoyl thioester reductase domain-containing protein [Chthoniobacterales bacterium]|nr:2-enoyl thioester reductase domain-containing protein [Chthoniobacterales bacterium]
MRKSRAVRYHRTGEPSQVVQVDEVDEVTAGAPGPGEVAVRMIFAPINPADLNMLEGKYGEARPLPDVPGNEGCGRVLAVGAGVDASWIGRLVLVDRLAWRDKGNWPADDLVAVPAGIEARQACLLRVNPPTAWCLLHSFADLKPGDWVVQNAATSAVGRAVVEIAKVRGWKTLNIVRRPEAAHELRQLGADAVAVDGPELADEAAVHLGGAKPRLGLNAVGGASATRLAGLLGEGTTLVTYGAMSKEALKIPNGFLIFRDLLFRGFWLTRWLRTASHDEKDALFGEIFRLAASGCFAPHVAAEFPITEVSRAVTQAARGGGKVLLCFQT